MWFLIEVSSWCSALPSLFCLMFCMKTVKMFSEGSWNSLRRREEQGLWRPTSSTTTALSQALHSFLVLRHRPRHRVVPARVRHPESRREETGATLACVPARGHRCTSRPRFRKQKGLEPELEWQRAPTQPATRHAGVGSNPQCTKSTTKYFLTAYHGQGAS